MRTGKKVPSYLPQVSRLLFILQGNKLKCLLDLCPFHTMHIVFFSTKMCKTLTASFHQWGRNLKEHRYDFSRIALRISRKKRSKNLTNFKPQTPAFQLRHYTYILKKNLLLKAVGLFKYVWPFSGHQALKG